MHWRAAAIFLVTACAALTPLSAAEDDARDEPETIFQRAFTQAMEPTERVRALESLAKEHPDSRWSDDALWVLGEAARRQQDGPRVLCYWQYLMTKRPDAVLEDYTRTLPIYRNSALPQVELLLVSEGNAFRSTDNRVLTGETGRVYLMNNAERFNPLPMVVWAELAGHYKRAGRGRLGLRAYRKALEAAPSQGRWAESCRARIRALEERLEAQAQTPEGEDASVVQAEPASEGRGPRDVTEDAPAEGPSAEEDEQRQTEPAESD
ncbi:MAG: hypothetical protein PVJ27_12050 [Candidatus Brocadiaceae bacterium]|jgi:hypothetical protein